MARRKKKRSAAGVLAALLGFICALVLGALFYSTMVYQSAGDAAQGTVQAQGGTLYLGSGTLLGETQTQQQTGGALCSVLTRTYALADGTQAHAITASPAAYLERLTAKGVEMQLITGFVIDGMDAVFALSGGTGLLAAREGDFVYMIEGPSDQQAMYELGAAARRAAP